MTVRPLRDRRYVVETEGGTYVVDAEAETCTCPDSAIREARCKHVRRVGLEIEAETVPRPGERTSACAVCGRQVFVPMSDAGPQLCDSHALAPGDLVRDRESGNHLLVVAATGERADAVTIEDGTHIADYETNANYGAHEPVFEAVYLASTRTPPDLGEVADGKRYGFPASRLRRIDPADSPSRRRSRRATAGGRGADRSAHDARAIDGDERTTQQTLPEWASAGT